MTTTTTTTIFLGCDSIEINLVRTLNTLQSIFWVQNFFAGAARRAGPDSMLILCLSVCVSEIISRPLIGRKLATSPDVVRRS